MAKKDEQTIEQMPVMPPMTSEQLMAMFLELQQRQVTLQEQQAQSVRLQEERSRPKDNPNYQAVSIFIKPGTGEGRQWAEDLKCEMYFGPMKLNKHPLTEAEVKALNRLQPVEKALITKVDRSQVRMTVRGEENVEGKLEKLIIDVDLKRDANPQHYPPLDALAHMLADAAPHPLPVAA